MSFVDSSAATDKMGVTLPALTKAAAASIMSAGVFMEETRRNERAFFISTPWVDGVADDDSFLRDVAVAATLDTAGSRGQ